MPNNRHARRHPGKPQGMSYADVLSRKQQLCEAVDKAARDTTVQLEADTHTQRAMWLMVVSIADAFGIGPDRMKRDFFPALQRNTEEIERMERETDLDYAYEKLRHRAEKVTGMPIEYLYEKDAIAAELKHAKEAVDAQKA